MTKIIKPITNVEGLRNIKTYNYHWGKMVASQYNEQIRREDYFIIVLEEYVLYQTFIVSMGFQQTWTVFKGKILK